MLRHRDTLFNLRVKASYVVTEMLLLDVPVQCRLNRRFKRWSSPGTHTLYVSQVGLDRDRRFKQGRFECLVACEPGPRRPPLPGSSSAQRTPGAAVPALFKWLVRRELQARFTNP